MIRVPENLFFWVGEKPTATPCRYEDLDGALIASIAGATLTAQCKIDTETGAEVAVTCTNTGDGTFTINWAKGVTASNFTKAGSMRIDVKVVQGDYTWYMDRFSIPIRDR